MATGVQSIADVMQTENHPTNEDILRYQTAYQRMIQDGRISLPIDSDYRVLPVIEPMIDYPPEWIRPWRSKLPLPQPQPTPTPTPAPVQQTQSAPGFLNTFASIVNWGVANPVSAGVGMVGIYMVLNSRLWRKRLF